MNNVLSLQLERERAWQARGGSNGDAFKRLALPPSNSEITGLDERRVLERLEAENALSIKKTQNAITRLKYIVCLEKHTCDHVKIWIRQSVICVRALRSRANRKPNPWNLNFA